MDIHGILANIQQRLSSGRFAFDRDALESDRLAARFAQAFAGDVLELSEARGVALEPETLRFQGTLHVLLGVYFQSVDVVLFGHQGQLECLFTATLPPTWTFASGFRDLPGYSDFSGASVARKPSLLPQLRFTGGPQVLFSSLDLRHDQDAQEKLRSFGNGWDAETVREGLNFGGKIDLHALGIWGALGKFARLRKGAHAFHGYLQDDTDDRELRLEVDLPSKRTYAKLFTVGVRSLVLYSSTSLRFPGAACGVQLIGGLAIGDQAEAPHDIVLEWPIGSTDLLVRNAEPIPFPGFDRFEDLLQGHLPTDDDTRFPISTDDLSDLFIRDISLALSLSSPDEAAISISVGPAEDWRHDVIHEVLAIEDLVLRWDLALAGRDIRFQVSGGFEIGGGLVDVTASFPDFVFSGDLALHQSIDLSAIVHHFAPDVPLPELSILDLELTADLKQKTYEFALDIASDWHVPIGPVSTMPLKNVYVELEKDEDGTFVTVDSTLEIAGVDVVLMATNAGGGEKAGWTFSGETLPGHDIPIGEVIADIATKFGGLEMQVPDSIEHLVIHQIGMTFNTGTKDFSFDCSAAFPIGAKEIDAVIKIDLTHQGDGVFEHKFAGALFMGGQEFDLVFDQRKDAHQKSTTLLATFHSEAGIKRDIHDLLADHLPDEVASAIPSGLTLTLNDVVLGYVKSGQGDTATSSTLFGIDMGSGINLSNLPLVGGTLPPDQTVKLSYRILVATHDFAKDSVAVVNSLMPAGIAALPVAADPGQPGLKKGLDLATTVQLGTETLNLDLPVALKKSDNGQQPTGAAGPVASGLPVDSDAGQNSDGVKWIKLQKSFGPLHIQQIGGTFAEGEITFLVDAALSAAGLTISLDGLSVSSPLNRFDPHFDLQGLGIDYANGPVEIGGAFLALGNDEYAGTALVKTEELTLSAIGAYRKYRGETSLFVYAVLDYPLGGPSFFFVTGMAGGFGYNRALRTPPVEQVAAFPLVEEATRGAGLPDDLTAELRKLRKYIPMDIGEYFLTLGVKFTSFKMVDSFALITVSFGDEFEIDLLGLSTLIVPTPEAGKAVTPLAEVQVALAARFVPNEGFLGVDARLTPASYVLSKDCHLTGGFAFWSWFSGKHEGDFVVTLGGYNPTFKVPAHYPKVPRLGFNWQVTGELSIKGGIYYALTSHALMAGGNLKAVYHDGSIRAWFEAGADFLISWQPYHYDARIHVGIGVSYTYWFFGTHHISVDVSADLHVWGPDFAGTAHVHLWIVSFTVGFGASGSSAPKPIDWATFKQAFLPPDKQICTLAIQDGLLDSDGKDGGPWVVNAKHLELMTNSVIPSSTAEFGKRSFEGRPFDIGSMAILKQSGDLQSTHSIKIWWTNPEPGGDKKRKRVEERFRFEPIMKRAPAGLWGPKLLPDVNDEGYVETLAGFRITPAKPPTPGETHPVKRENLLYETEPVLDSFGWDSPVAFKPGTFTAKTEMDRETSRREKITDTIMTKTAATNRATLLQGFGLDAADVRIGGLDGDDFLRAPQVGTFG